MSIQQIGFLDTSSMTARWVLKYREKAQDGILKLRDLNDEGEYADLPILAEWRSAKAVLSKVRAGAAPHFGGVAPVLGRAYIEALPPTSGIAWVAEHGDAVDAFLRTRTCLIPSPGAVTHCGSVSASLLVGIVNVIDMKQLCSEVNHGEHTRVHLVVDVKIPDVEADA